jgi:hypothetical protein
MTAQTGFSCGPDEKWSIVNTSARQSSSAEVNSTERPESSQIAEEPLSVGSLHLPQKENLFWDQGFIRTL